MDPAPLKEFVKTMTALVDADLREAELVPKAKAALTKLLSQENWLDDSFQEAGSQFYRQYLLHCDAQERFSVQSFVWGPGQSTPVHDHTVWGLVGVYKGAERCQRFCLSSGKLAPDGAPVILSAGDIDYLSPTVGDIHTVSNAFDDQVSISIHVYGGNVGNIKRHVFDPVTSATKPFVSGYSNTQVPNIWDQSSMIRAAISDVY